MPGKRQLYSVCRTDLSGKRTAGFAGSVSEAPAEGTFSVDRTALETEFGKEMIRKIDADPRVIRTGLVQGQELAELFSNCRLFVLPSHTEGLSLALLEAMSCGGRCLVSDIPAIR